MERQALFDRRRTAFTLTEIMIVIIIMSIMVSLALPSFQGAREKSFDKTAISGLRTLRAAERQFFAMRETYYPAGSTSNIADINGNLSIDINNRDWTFTVFGGGVFLATAARGGRTWTITLTTEPTCAGACV